MKHDEPSPADALVDAALRETLGGEKPTDQSDTILARVANAQVAKVTSQHPSEEPTMNRPWYRSAAAGWAVAASLLIVGGVVTLPQFVRSPPKSAQVLPKQLEQELLVVESDSWSKGASTITESIDNKRNAIDSLSLRSEKGSKEKESEAPLALGRAIKSGPVPASGSVVLGDRSRLASPAFPQRSQPLSSAFPFSRRSGIGSEFADESSWHPGRRMQRGDRYEAIAENPFIVAQGDDALSTFSIDVDTASYANTRQFLMQGNRLPPRDAVRIEELVNYFDYAYEAPVAGGPDAEGPAPFAAAMEVAACPWAPKHRLVRIALKGREVEAENRPLSNLVFLIDVSGSMNAPNKLPLVVRGLKQLARRLGENDRVAIVVYASSQGLTLDSTPGSDRQTILASLDRLAAGGSTAGGAGIQLAYKIAEENHIPGGTNRVILCSDGDFNVGLTGTEALADLVERKAKETGVFLSVLGFGRGNLNDAMMETISGRGNGNYAYIDNRAEARKVLVDQMTGTLVTIAKDVKIQVEFNPAKVARYRLIGYENRLLANQDFNDDTKDAGEIGAGHAVTAFYEIVPVGVALGAGVDPLKYQPTLEEEPTHTTASDTPPSDELLTLKLRYKQPENDTSSKLEFTLTDDGIEFDEASRDFRFASSVAQFGLLLRKSEHRGSASYEHVIETAEATLGNDPHGYREEFLDLVDQAQKATR